MEGLLRLPGDWIPASMPRRISKVTARVFCSPCLCRNDVGPDPVGDPLLRFSRFIQVVVLVVLRTLQGQLKCEAILGDLIDLYSRGNFSRSRVSSALLARFGGSVRLP